MRTSERLNCRILALLLPIAAMLGGCATVPPPSTPIADIKSVAGQWKGFVTAQGGKSYPYTLNIRDDGSWEATAPTLPPGKFVGTMSVSDGKLLFKSGTSGRTGAYTLHQKDEKRMLIGCTDDRVACVELTSVK